MISRSFRFCSLSRCLLSQKIGDSSTIAHRLEMADEFAKARGEKLAAYVPVGSDACRGDIMPHKLLPAEPELFIPSTRSES